MPCILPDDIKKLRQAITEQGGFAGLREKTAQERVKFFSQYVDVPGKTTTADWLNREIERRVLKPGQIQATKEWLKKLEKKKVKITNQTALIDRITNKKDVFNPKSLYAEGLAKQALGFEVSRDDAKILFEKAKSVNEYKSRLLAIDPKYLERKASELKNMTPEAQNARIELGKKLVEFQREYEAINLKAQATAFANKSYGGKAWEVALKIAGNIKSIKASVDVSFFRQLQSVVYVSEASFIDAMKTGYKVWAGKKDFADTVMADILTRPNALNGNYNQFGVEVGIKEEAFPESWLSEGFDKLGGFGEWANVFRRSENAFNAAIQTARADLFDMMWENSNGDIKLLKDQRVGEAINQLTGRGKLHPKFAIDPQTSRVINNLMFAPKWLASRINTFVDLRYIGQIKNKTPEGLRARAAVWNLILIASLLALRGLFKGDDETPGSWADPRSADFGKLILGRTRFDLTGGTASLITLTSRLITQTTVTTDGRKRPVKVRDLIGNFLAGKSSPGLQVGMNLIHAAFHEGEFVDYRGKPLKWNTTEDVVNNIADFIFPISVAGATQAGFDVSGEDLASFDAEAWGEVLGVLTDIFGIAANTYDKK